MKKSEKMLHAIGYANEDLVAEAMPHASKPRRRFNTALAACLAACFIALNLVLFIPYGTTPPSVERYESSEYYDVIMKLNEANYKKPRYKNNFEAVIEGFFANFLMVKAGTAIEDSAAPANGADRGQSYEETTDNQVSGVIESDIVKRSDKYIYYLNDATLYVYSIEGENSRLVSKYNIDTANARFSYYDRWEMYLSEDCATVTVIAPCTVKTETFDAHVAVISLDVSDPKNISERGRASVSGGLISSRLTGGKILLITEFYAGNADFSDESTFVPQIDVGNGAECVPAESIVSPDKLSSSRYTVVCRFDEDTLALEDSASLLSYSDHVYVSAERVYAARRFNEKVETGEYTYTVTMTEISCVGYGEEKFENEGTFKVEGYIKDQYSLDEADGMLRVVTTTSNNYISHTNRTTELGIMAPPAPDKALYTLGTSASLFVIDLENGEIRASVEYFAPVGETVRSVRFDGTAAYVCTAVQQTDPVFFFDLTDLDSIKVKDTGTISGFSTSLINMGNGFLLGIGQGDSWNTVKVEVYEEAAEGVRSVAVYEKKGANYAEEYKSYLINRKEGLVGLGINFEYSAGEYLQGDTERYVLLHFNGYDLIPVVNTALEGDNAKKRGILIDGMLYLIGETAELKVVDTEK